MKQPVFLLAALILAVTVGSGLDAGRPRAISGVGMQEQSALPGSYVLVTIDGHPLPYAPIHPGRPADAPPPPTVVGSTFTVGADSTFQQTMAFRITRQGAEQTVERQFQGTYARDGEGYVFSWVGAGQTPVIVRGDTLVLNNEGMLFTYLKQKAR